MGNSEKGAHSDLMDYSSGTNLTQKQWDAIEKNKFVWSWLDEEEDGALWGRLFSKTFKGKLVFENMVKSVDFLQKTNSRSEVVILKQALAIFGYYPGNNPKNPPANWISVPTAYINNPLFDDVTKQMVEDFQRNHYSANNLQLLVIDGIVGKETLETLDLYLWFTELQNNPLTTLIGAIKAQLFKDVFNLSALTNDYNALSANEKAEKKVTLAELWVKLYDISNRTGCMIIGNGTGNYKVVENGNTNIEIVSLSASEQDLFDWLMRRGRDKYGARLIDILPQLEKFYNDNMGNGNFCRFCPITKIITPDACTAMEDLYTRAGSTVNAENAIKKLCAKNSGFGYMSTYNGSITSQSEWIIIADLLALTNNEIIAFFEDVNGNHSNTNALNNNISLINENIVEAWKLVRIARCANPQGNCNSKMPQDFQILQEITNISTSDLAKLDNEVGLTALVKANIRAKCNTCGTSGEPFLGLMSDYIKNLNTFTQYHLADKFTQAKVLLKSTSQRTREGQIFIVRALAENQTEFNGITAFEYTGLIGCEPDVVIGSGTNAIYCEFKSWSDRSPADDADDKEENTGSPASGAFYFFKNGYTSASKVNNSYKQFKALLSNISTMSQLRYYFDGKKISGSQANKVAFVKNIFKILLQNTTIPATRTASVQTEIFETIWANNLGLRQSLFKNVITDFTLADNIIKPIARAEFISMISSTTNGFYNFIKVK